MAAPEFQTDEVDGIGGDGKGMVDYWVGASASLQVQDKDRNSIRFASVACVETTGGSASGCKVCKVVVERVEEQRRGGAEEQRSSQIQCGRPGMAQSSHCLFLSCLCRVLYFFFLIKSNDNWALGLALTLFSPVPVSFTFFPSPLPRRPAQARTRHSLTGRRNKRGFISCPLWLARLD